MLLTTSFIYLRNWLNEHPFKNEPEARLVCNLNNGSPITPDTIDKIMKQLRERIIRLISNCEVKNEKESIKLQYLVKTKKWNPYCIRHSAITADSDYLPDYALKKKVRWVMNSKQGNRYIKRRMGNDLKQKILAYNGIIPSDDLKPRQLVEDCPKCKELVNKIENKYCPHCSYPLVPSAFDEIKEAEEKRLKCIEEQIQFLMETQKEILECQKYPEKLIKVASEK